MILNITIFFLFLFSNFSFSQIKKIELPTIPSPENFIYNLLHESKVDDPTAWEQNVIGVKQQFYEYSDDEIVIQNTTTFHRNKENNWVKNSSYFDGEKESPNETIFHFSNQKDSVDGLLQITQTDHSNIADEENNTTHFFYKNNHLIKKQNDFNHSEYQYDGNVITILDFKYEGILTDDLEIEEYYVFNHQFTAAQYNKKNQILVKEYYQVVGEIIESIKISYTYDTQNKLVGWEQKNQIYFSDNLNFFINLDQQDYAKMEKVESQLTLNSSFIYNDQGEIITLETRSTSGEKEIFTISKNIGNSNKTYDHKITSPNGNSHLQYFFQYDKNNNPIEISSFLVSNGELKKQNSSTFDILYSN